jgi:hypothetical protein
MAIGMEQCEIIESVRTAFHSPHDMMRVPVGVSSNQLTTDWTAALLSVPELP